MRVSIALTSGGIVCPLRDVSRECICASHAFKSLHRVALCCMSCSASFSRNVRSLDRWSACTQSSQSISIWQNDSNDPKQAEIYNGISTLLNEQQVAKKAVMAASGERVRTVTLVTDKCPCFGIIDHNSLHLMHLMQPQIFELLLS